MIKKLISISIFLLLFGNFALAQEVSPTEALFRVYEATNNSVNNYIYILTVVAAIFGVFITGLVLFFAVKQISADREIRSYKESLKQQEDKLKEWAKNFYEQADAESKRGKEVIKEIEKQLETSKHKIPSKKLEELREKISNLERNFDFQKGLAIGAQSSTAFVYTSPSLLENQFYHPTLCQKCGKKRPTSLGRTEGMIYPLDFLGGDDRCNCDDLTDFIGKPVT